MDNLPCFPSSFIYELRKGNDKKIDDGVLKQFKIIETLCNRPDVEFIVNAGDADREGEIIVRTCIQKALKTEKAIKRLWLPDQTPETVRAAVADMKDDEAYDNLANEGYARTYIDWLYGVNLTRYATLRTGTLLRVGRVIVPIVKAIYDRDMAIKNFVPEKYYSIISKEETNGEVVELQSKLRFNNNEYEKALDACKNYNIPTLTTHKSDDDAYLTMQLTKAICEKLNISLEKLVEKYNQHCSSVQEYSTRALSDEEIQFRIQRRKIIRVINHPVIKHKKSNHNINSDEIFAFSSDVIDEHCDDILDVLHYIIDCRTFY
jgi:DNA topoisomerase IA